MLGFPDGYFCAYLIGLDCPADQRLRPLVRPDRRPLDDVVHWDRWHGVELRGFEPLTSSMPWKRATNCAKAPGGPFRTLAARIRTPRY